MSSRALALTAIGTQLILGLILVAILLSMQGQHTVQTQPAFSGDQPIHVVVDPVPTCAPTWQPGACGALTNGGDE